MEDQQANRDKSKRDKEGLEETVAERDIQDAGTGGEGRLTRRKLLAALGVTGAAVVSGGLIHTLNGASSVTDAVYGNGKNPLTDADHIRYRAEAQLPQRTVGDKLRERVSVKDFGAAGDGSTDDTGAIQAAIDSAVAVGGREVFFPAGTYHDAGPLANADGVVFVGDGVHFTSGREAVSLSKHQADIIELRGQAAEFAAASPLPAAHPFYPAPSITVLTDTRRHRSRGSGMVILDDRWVFVFREAHRHNAVDTNAVMKVAFSRNAGQTFESETVIFDDDRYDVSDPRMWRMDDNRIGLWFRLYDSNVEVVAFVFMHSDDKGQTWSQPRVFDNLQALGFPFTVIRYPSSAGGNDNGGWILFNHGNGGIRALYTTDNGAAWTESGVLAQQGGLGGEVSVVRLGDTDRWIMTTRGSRVLKSTNLFNWDIYVADGAPIGNNSSVLFYHKGHLTWLAASRPWHYENNDSRAIPVNGEKFQGLVSRTVEAEAVWNNPGAWGDWQVFAYIPHIHFDMSYVEKDGWIYGIFGVHEEPHRFSQLAVMCSSLAPRSHYDAHLANQEVTMARAQPSVAGGEEYPYGITTFRADASLGYPIGNSTIVNFKAHNQRFSQMCFNNGAGAASGHVYMRQWYSGIGWTNWSRLLIENDIQGKIVEERGDNSSGRFMRTGDMLECWRTVELDLNTNAIQNFDTPKAFQGSHISCSVSLERTGAALSGDGASREARWAALAHGGLTCEPTRWRFRGHGDFLTGEVVRVVLYARGQAAD